MNARKSCFLIVLLTALALQIAVASDVSEVLRLVNLERAAVGAPPLALDPLLTLAAQRHSNDMAAKGFMSHTGSNGSTPWDRIKATGYAGMSLAENVAAGHLSPNAVMNAWMSSDGHRRNILNPNYRAIGIGIAYNPNAQFRYYWTQNFGSVVSGPAPTPLPTPPLPPTPPMPTPPVPAPVGVAIGFFHVLPSTVMAGSTCVGTIRLTEPAPRGGFTVLLSSTNPAIAKAPEKLTFAWGQSVKQFLVHTYKVRWSTFVVISAQHGKITKCQRLRVRRG